MTDDWQVLSGRGATDDSLYEGVPLWLSVPLADWIDMTTASLASQVQFVVGTSSQSPRARLVAEFDLRARLRMPLSAHMAGGAPVSEVLEDRDDAELVLDFVDFLLMRDQEAQPWQMDSTPASSRLEEILRTAGSAWQVGRRGKFSGLERRLSAGVTVAAGGVIASSALAGELLAEAWHAAYGRQPDPEEAYEKAIKAVEESAARVVSPKNQIATLGTMARDMENQGDWSLPLMELSNHSSRDALVRAARMLWSGQEGRHGGNGYRKPTQGEAESAVLLAVALVHAFSSGLLTRRS